MIALNSHSCKRIFPTAFEYCLDYRSIIGLSVDQDALVDSELGAIRHRVQLIRRNIIHPASLLVPRQLTAKAHITLSSALGRA